MNKIAMYFVSAFLVSMIVGCDHPGRVEIKRVLVADASASQGATSVSEVVASMRSIDTRGCPSDFREAYMAHVHAWENVLLVEAMARRFDQDFNSGGAFLEAFLRGFLGDPTGKMNEAFAAQSQLASAVQTAQAEVIGTFQRVEQIAIRYGVRTPRT